MTQHSRDTPQFYLTAPSPCPYLAGKEERKVFTHLVGEKAGDLNDALAEGVARARRLGVHAHYVDVSAAFAGHNVCDPEPWVNGVVLDPAANPPISPASFHPTAVGQQAYADVVGEAIARHR